MLEKIRTFWANFWYAMKEAYNKAFKEIPREFTQKYRETKRINLLSIVITKLNDKVNNEATFDVVSDSDRTKELEELCKNLEDNRYRITEEMLGNGDMWVLPAHTTGGKLYHRYVAQEELRVLNMDGEQITDIIAIIDKYYNNEGKIFLLNRRQTLEKNTLTIETYVTNEKNDRVHLERWEQYENMVKITNVDNVGVGRFKSPTSSRGLSPIYGVPLNFGCEAIEENIFNDLEMIKTEFENGESKIFADPLILRKGRDKMGYEGWKIPENVFPIDTRGGQTSANIDIFSPQFRYEGALKQKFIDDCMMYEQQIGTDRGFLTPMETGGATATEIKIANSSTRALLEKIRTAIKIGVETTIKADAIFLNIPDDMYSIKFDFADVFEDYDKQYDRLANAVDRGVAEKADEVQWLFPDMSQDEIEEKLARISERNNVQSEMAIERILNNE